MPCSADLRFMKRRHLRLIPWMFVGFASAGAGQADQVVSGEHNYPGAKITGFAQGKVAFRTADGQLRSLWISDVDMIIVERGGIFDDFNQGERFAAAGEPDRAIIRYRRTLRLSETFWSDLIASRLLVACDRADRLDQATLNFIRVVRGEWSGPETAVRLIPKKIPATPTPEAMRAIEHLEAAIAARPPEEQRLPLELARFEILSRVGDDRTLEAARAVASMRIPEPQRCERVYAIQLSSLIKLGEDQFGAEEYEILDRAIEDCPQALLPSFLLFRGRMLLSKAESRDDIIRATWPFMRVVAHMPDDPRAADGLYETAVALEHIGREDKAIDLLTECLAHEKVSEETRQKAENELARLRTASATSG